MAHSYQDSKILNKIKTEKINEEEKYLLKVSFTTKNRLKCFDIQEYFNASG
jgi:hypothetical protein